MKARLLSPGRYRGFARLAIWVARIVADWPRVALMMIDGDLAPSDVARRWRQELAILRGATEREAREVL